MLSVLVCSSLACISLAYVEVQPSLYLGRNFHANYLLRLGENEGGISTLGVYSPWRPCSAAENSLFLPMSPILMFIATAPIIL